MADNTLEELEPLMHLSVVPAPGVDVGHAASGMWIYAGARVQRPVAVWIRCSVSVDAQADEWPVECIINAIWSGDKPIRLDTFTSWELAAMMASPQILTWRFRSIAYRLLDLEDLGGRPIGDVMRYSPK